MEALLQKAGLGTLLQNFIDERIEAHMIQNLTDNELTRLGVATIGARSELRSVAKEVNTAPEPTPNEVRRFAFRRQTAPPNSRPKNKKQRTGWTAQFVCLSNSQQIKVPTASEKEVLIDAGLGLKKIYLDSTDDEESVISRIMGDSVEDGNMTGFPQLKEAGGFELMRTLQNGRCLKLIAGPWSAKILRNKVGAQARIYIRPIQKNLSTKPQNRNTTSGRQASEACKQCGHMFPLSDMRTHIQTCAAIDQAFADLPDLSGESLTSFPDSVAVDQTNTFGSVHSSGHNVIPYNRQTEFASFQNVESSSSPGGNISNTQAYQLPSTGTFSAVPQSSLPATQSYSTIPQSSLPATQSYSTIPQSSLPAAQSYSTIPQSSLPAAQSYSTIPQSSLPAAQSYSTIPQSSLPAAQSYSTIPQSSLPAAQSYSTIPQSSLPAAQSYSTIPQSSLPAAQSYSTIPQSSLPAAQSYSTIPQSSLPATQSYSTIPQSSLPAAQSYTAIPQSSLPNSDDNIEQLVEMCINFCKENQVENPVEILRKLQKEIVSGRELEIEDMTVPLDGDTAFILADRDDLLKTGMEEIRTLANSGTAELRKTIELQFYDEEAVDQGGPRKEFFRLILSEIKEKYFDTGLRQLLADDYKTVGIIFALSMLQNGSIPSFMGQDILEELWSSQEPSPCILQLRKGMNMLGLYDVCLALPTFRFLFHPSQSKLTIKKLTTYLKPAFSEEGSNAYTQEKLVYNMFIMYLREVAGGRRGTISLGSVLCFATSTDVEPMLGFRLHPSIHFAEVRNSYLPTANTCINSLTLPRPPVMGQLPNKDTLFELYDYAFSNTYYGLK